MTKGIEVKAENIRFAFRGRDGEEGERVFENTTLSAKPEFTTFLLGPSGSGKSLMLKILAGLLTYELGDRASFQGDVFWQKENISELKPMALNRKRSELFGLVFQDQRLVEYLTGMENITLPLRIQGKVAKDCLRKNKTYHDSLGLERFWEKRVDEMSGGQRQRIAIARALITDPPVIMADEPFTGLDSNLRKALDNVFEEERAKGKTVIIVTHDDRKASSSPEEHRNAYRLNPNKGEFIQIGTDGKKRGKGEKLKGSCPYCGDAGKWTQKQLENTSIEIDICSHCKGVWLDAGEYQEILGFPRTIMEEIEAAIEEIKKEKLP